MAQEILNVSQLKVGVEDKEILHGVDLSLNKGETHVLMGPNGAGKSCLLYTSPSPRDGATSRMPSSA